MIFIFIRRSFNTYITPFIDYRQLRFYSYSEPLSSFVESIQDADSISPDKQCIISNIYI